MYIISGEKKGKRAVLLSRGRVNVRSCPHIAEWRRKAMIMRLYASMFRLHSVRIKSSWPSCPAHKADSGSHLRPGNRWGRDKAWYEGKGYAYLSVKRNKLLELRESEEPLNEILGPKWGSRIPPEWFSFPCVVISTFCQQAWVCKYWVGAGAAHC